MRKCFELFSSLSLSLSLSLSALCFIFCYSLSSGQLVSQSELSPSQQLQCGLNRGGTVVTLGMYAPC